MVSSLKQGSLTSWKKQFKYFQVLLSRNSRTLALSENIIVLKTTRLTECFQTKTINYVMRNIYV